MNIYRFGPLSPAAGILLAVVLLLCDSTQAIAQKTALNRTQKDSTTKLIASAKLQSALKVPFGGVDIRTSQFSPNENPITGRFVFYNDSSFDQTSDSDAIATDIEPLFDGVEATFANYSSYAHGINGIIIDFAGTHGDLDESDFMFQVGNVDDADSWTQGPAPDSITTEAGGGVGGTDRVTLIWTNNRSIKGQWLQVRVLGNTSTRLAEDDVFYFGSVPGDVGNSATDAIVDTLDLGGIRQNFTGFETVGLENDYDINRDGRVDTLDLGSVRENFTGFVPVDLITPQSSDLPGIGFARGVNFGNMLEAPAEGQWGLFVEERFFDRVVDCGMDHIRLPISWTHHTSQNAPYTIDPVFFDRVDWCVEQAVSRGLKIIVNVHHYDELNTDPVAETPRALAMWNQIATRYLDCPKSVYFEVLNEPHDEFNVNPSLWEDYLDDALAVIRSTNPIRKVLIGGTQYNSISGLGNFDPPDDPFLIASFHYYEPFLFTHQGANWIDPIPPTGVLWINDRMNFGSGWQNWSWGTTFTPGIGSLAIEYTQGWAGARFHNNTPVENADTFTFQTEGDLLLKVAFFDATNEIVYEENIQTGAGVNEHVVDINFSEPIHDVLLQNLTPDPQNQYQLSTARLDGPGFTVNLIETEADAISSDFLAAQLWGIQHGLPMHMGEFGAFSMGELPSRVRWTTFVREQTELLDMPFSYWEFGAGFGVYDPDASAWRTQLIQSLIPEFNP